MMKMPWTHCIVVGRGGDAVSEVVVKMSPYYRDEKDALQKGQTI
jgi:hypothetical protein